MPNGPARLGSKARAPCARRPTEDEHSTTAGLRSRHTYVKPAPLLAGWPLAHGGISLHERVERYHWYVRSGGRPLGPRNLLRRLRSVPGGRCVMKSRAVSLRFEIGVLGHATLAARMLIDAARHRHAGDEHD